MPGADVAPFYVMDMMKAAAAREAAGERVVHLEVGQPSTGAPAAVVSAAQRALASGDALGYTGVKGIPELQAQVVAHYRAWYGVDIDPAQVQLTMGSSSAFVLSFLGFFDPGSRIGVPVPGYPCYRNTLNGVGMTPVAVEVGPETGFRVTPDALDAAGPMDGLLIASPNNPTGTVIDAADMDAITRWCASHGVRLISDEIYHGLVYGTPARSALEFDDGALVINSMSKHWSMTGWRLGWMIVPLADEARIERLAANLFICPPALCQVAAVEAFSSAAQPELAGHVARYRTNRDVLLAGLPRAGLHRFAPADGAFYLYADVSELTADSRDLCRRWLEEAGVATSPGIDFDPLAGHRSVRFSFAGSTEDMHEAVELLSAWRS